MDTNVSITIQYHLDLHIYNGGTNRSCMNNCSFRYAWDEVSDTYCLIPLSSYLWVHVCTIHFYQIFRRLFGTVFPHLFCLSVCLVIQHSENRSIKSINS